MFTRQTRQEPIFLRPWETKTGPKTFAKLHMHSGAPRRTQANPGCTGNTRFRSFSKKNGYPMGGETLAIFFSLNRLNTLFPRLLSIDSST